MASFERLALVALAAPLLGLGECGEGDTDLDPDLQPIECHLGTVEAASGQYRELAAGDPVELVLGFQGFLYVELLVRSPEAPDEANATMSITVDGMDPSSGEQPQVRFSAEDGAVTDRILLFLTSNNVDSYAGRNGRIAVKLEGDAKGCVTAQDVVLVDEVE